MTVTAVRLPDDLEKKIRLAAHKAQRSKGYIIRKAVEEYIEDYMDYLMALDRLNDKNDPIVSDKEAKKLLGLK